MYDGIKSSICECNPIKYKRKLKIKNDLNIFAFNNVHEAIYVIRYRCADICE